MLIPHTCGPTRDPLSQQSLFQECLQVYQKVLWKTPCQIALCRNGEWSSSASPLPYQHLIAINAITACYYEPPHSWSPHPQLEFHIWHPKKLRSPIYDLDECRWCLCGKHIIAGETMPLYALKTKQMVHNFIRDCWVLALQQVIAAARYIIPTAKLETEKPHLLDCNLGADPLDMSFDIDPSPLLGAPVTYKYSCVGGNITITSPVEPFGISGSTNIVESITAAAAKHLQKEKRRI